MSNIGKISSLQMFSILFLCRIISLFTFMLPSAGYIPSGDRILTSLAVFLFEILYCGVLIFTLRRTENKGIIAAVREKSAPAARIIAVIYTLAFIWFAGIGTARFELFISTVMFPNSELYFMIILLLGASAYASLKGLEAIGRASVILFFLLGLSVVFILVSVTGEFRRENLSPLLTEGLSPLLSFSFYVSVRAAELMTLYVTAPDVNGNTGAAAIKFSAVFSAVSTVILVMLAGVTGEF
ncbi:MAG: GerAB/ArcD/ProY family transporter [Clostridia bacterium]|nr:GerAB/ArcD/ProY family transporter [Clostridia bacterium]